MYYYQGDIFTLSMITGLVLLGMATMGLTIRAVVIAALMYQRDTNPNPEYQTMKNRLLAGQWLLIASLTAFCAAFYFSLNLPLYAVASLFVASLAITGLSTWIWNRKIKRWLS